MNIVGTYGYEWNSYGQGTEMPQLVCLHCIRELKELAGKKMKNVIVSSFASLHLVCGELMPSIRHWYYRCPHNATGTVGVPIMPHQELQEFP